MIHQYIFLLCVSLIGSSELAYKKLSSNPVTYGSVLFKEGKGLTCFSEYKKSLLAARIEVEV